MKEYGSMGNRLLTFSHLSALAAAQDWKLHNFSFRPYSDYFEHFAGKGVSSLPGGDPIGEFLGSSRGAIWGKFLQRWLRNPTVLQLLRRSGRLVEASDLSELSVTDPVIHRATQAGGLRVWTAWNLHFHELRDNWRASVLHWFRPTAAIRFSVDNALMEVPGSRLLVGIHVRRGDYEHYQGGRYFFDHTYYQSVMSVIATRMLAANPHFLIASNEPIPDSMTKGFSATVLRGNEAEDLCALGRCQLILGPPSTYSEWAAFVGGGKLVKLDGDLPAPESICHVMAIL
jgi:hypothetical protein